VISRSIYNLKTDTIYMYDIPFDRSFLQLSNGIKHVMPSTDRKLELTAKASMAQPVSQPAVCCNVLIFCLVMLYLPTERWKMSHLYNYIYKFKIFYLKWPNDAVLLFSASNQSFHVDNHCINLSGAWDVVYMNASGGYS